ncbi:MAG: tyrosine--tRNA ligase [Candidatus Abawacabacteria bacterium RIFCSPHIGHO2_01_FULL_46_8]|uniref:Tyrosine--tRNA ligase n=1 Tax=Candidatus Abawacabacteria bacterium RIFCSPHIGHO2_01_FULL_46_8 TaxID=1817815 RepID=A0A1F4XLV7_9BACT|nr:MAG: tyrosine--tRNA ligase [Candidatus Abawacabacteria bacterium RIFCSPHIGHO2_01_FULL_46_8]
MLDPITEVLTRRTSEVLVRQDLEKLLRSKKRLRIYYGIDPSGHQLHLGHAVCLLKFRELQSLGHEMILLIGDFTAMIGDPTDRAEARIQLTAEQVKTNFKDYKKQVSKLLDFNNKKNPIRIVYNSKWLKKMSLKHVIELGAHFSVQQNMARDMYQERLKHNKPIWIHEFLYPLMQGYDSVALDVDLEIGGTDQTFNMLAGRELQRAYNNRDKHILTCPILEGTDGRKMSKTYHNTINFSDSPEDMFGKVMSIKDDLILRYFELVTETPQMEIDKIKDDLAQGGNPRDAKLTLAKAIVSLFHSPSAAKKGEQHFRRVFQEQKLPKDIPSMKIKEAGLPLFELMVQGKLASSNSEAKRLIQQGGVTINDAKISDPFLLVKGDQQDKIIKVGKRRFLRVHS